MEIAPELAALLQQQTLHQQQILTIMEQILRTLLRLTERVAAVDDVLTAILEADENNGECRMHNGE